MTRRSGTSSTTFSAYDRVRNQIHNGDLIAFTPDGLIGNLITHWTGASHSHVGVACWIVFPGNARRLVIVEAIEGRGVQWRALSETEGFDILRLGLTWTPRADLFVRQAAGRAGYDLYSIVRRCLGLPAKLDDGAYICSEFAGQVLRRMDLEVPDQALDDPGNLVGWLLDQGAPLHRVRVLP